MNRTARTASTAAAALLGAVLSAGPALADHNPLAPQEGAVEHSSLSVGAALLLFVALPAALLLGTAALVWLPGVVRGAGRRYRPGRAWNAAPLWFAGPADPLAAVETAPALASARGGAGGDW